LSIEFTQVDFAEQHRALESGEVDVAFVVGPAPSSIVSVPLLEWPRLVAVSKSLADRHPHDIHDRLRDDPIALPNQMASQAWRLAWTLMPHASGPTFVVGEDSMEAMLAVVGAGRAYCVVPEYVARFYPHPRVTFLSVEGVGPCVVGVGALSSRLAEPPIGAVLKIAESVTRRGRSARRSEPGDATTAGRMTG
jgi:DNA-binding transcriptional LysR family regulator